MFEYDQEFSLTDRKLIAVEYADFGRAITTGEVPEVDGVRGSRSVAFCYALMESQVAGRVVQDRKPRVYESINLDPDVLKYATRQIGTINK